MATKRISESFRETTIPNAGADANHADANHADANHADANQADATQADAPCADDRGGGRNSRVADYLRHMEHRTIQTVGEHGVLGRWLTTLFPAPKVDYLLALYRVGALPDGRTVFPYVSRAGYTVDAKVMAYGLDGHRSGTVTWLHALDRLERPLPLPLFGEHLAGALPFAPLCLVESEKTALVAKLWRPDCTWMATGGKSMFAADRCRALAGRTVVVWPDADAVGEWMAAVATIGPQLGIRFRFPAAYLRRIREGPPKGDLADMIVSAAHSRI